jgi:sulfoxide reductase heme-binding subunit YedZ
MSLTSRRVAKRLLRHHLPLAAASLLAFAALYFTRPYPDWVMRASFSTAYPATVLLAVTLLVGPWKWLRKGSHPVSSDLRRDVGIWAGILSLIHAVIGQCVHLRGRPWLYYMYSAKERHHSVPGFPLRHDLFGWANWTGLAATLLVIALLATSNDVALRRMGTPGWKRLQRWNYAVFALVAFHGFAYQLGIEKQRLGFVLAILACVAVTVAMQTAGVIARARRDGRRRRALA